MKTDSAEFKKRLDEAKQRSKKIDELRVEVIKGQLQIEEALDGFLAKALFNPDHVNIEGMNFHPKAKLALALSLNEDRDPLWAVLWAVNQLRNEIAHEIDSKEIDQKMKFLRKKYIDALGSNQNVMRKN